MQVKDIVDILKCQILVEGDLESPAPEVVGREEMMDMHCIVFVRGKPVNQQVLDLAEMKDMTVLSSPYRMFTACGLLFENGLRGGCDIS